jgi:restriction system protein
LYSGKAVGWSGRSSSDPGLRREYGLHQSKEGDILTTSTFTKDAVDFVERIEGKKVVLINGDQLADLMIDHGLGVTTTKTYEIREVSNDFFDESDL